MDLPHTHRKATHMLGTLYRPRASRTLVEHCGAPACGTRCSGRCQRPEVTRNSMRTRSQRQRRLAWGLGLSRGARISRSKECAGCPPSLTGCPRTAVCLAATRGAARSEWCNIFLCSSSHALWSMPIWSQTQQHVWDCQDGLPPRPLKPP